jgi:hypothetical protein
MKTTTTTNSSQQRYLHGLSYIYIVDYILYILLTEPKSSEQCEKTKVMRLEKKKKVQFIIIN